MVLTPEAEDDNAVTEDDTKNMSGVEPVENGVDVPITCKKVYEEGEASPDTTNKPDKDEDDPDIADFTEDAIFVVERARDGYESVHGKDEGVNNGRHGEVIGKAPKQAAQKNIRILVY